MERSLDSLTYKGSIGEAIGEAKLQKKLFVVYISGEDAESKNIESSVEESLSKYCILLHIREGSADAANFSAIYPLKSVPSITAVGYNGLQVWQNEGPVSAEFLASALEKAWLSLHIQETTASFLTAALTSKKQETSASGVPEVDELEQGSSSNTTALSSTPEPSAASMLPEKDSACEIQETTASFLTAALTSKKQETSASGVPKVDELEQGSSSNTTALSSTPEPSAASMLPEKDSACEMGGKEETVKSGDETSLNPTTSIPVFSGNGAESVMLGTDSSEYKEMPTKDDGLTAVKSSNHFSAVPVKDSQLITEKGSKDVQIETSEGSNNREVGESDSSLFVDTPTEVHLNIKLPDGSSLKEKFPLEHTLTIVKNYVDKNQSSDVGSYDLAIPYPRKVFTGQDLHKSLFELGLFNRQALIVVPHQRSSGFNREKSSSSSLKDSTSVSSSSGSDEGYFSYLKRAMSFVNPFSYLGSGASSSNTAQESNSGLWQYSPNPAMRNSNISGTERSYSPDEGSSRGTTDSRTRRLAKSGVGSNIHVLKHDEDDERFADRNSFWNGNSTQYGGNSDEK